MVRHSGGVHPHLSFSGDMTHAILGQRMRNLPSRLVMQIYERTMMRHQPDSSGMEPPNPGSSSTVLLTLSAKDLRDIDINSVSDPFCVVSRVVNSGQRSKKMEEVGRTETINNSLEPEWSTKVKANFYRRHDQRLKFDIFHKGGPNKNRILGSASATIDEILDAPMHRIVLSLFSDGKQRGTLTVAADEVRPGRQESVYFVISATGLDRKDFFGKCDPFLKIMRVNHDNTLQLAFRTKYREQTLSPKWKPFEVPIDQLCYGDKNREFIIECYDWDQDGNHDLVGCVHTTVNKLIHHQETEGKLVHTKKARKSKKYTDSGTLHFHKVYCWKDHSYEDFLNAGTQLDFMFGVSFPSSWQDNRVHADQYDAAIRSIADIFAQFQLQNQCFEAYGMGARIINDPSNHPIFPLDLESGQARCQKVEGLLYAYHKARKLVDLSGGLAQFAPLIRLAAQTAARAPHDGSAYIVLILITDGTIADLEKTKQEIIKASTLPLSIVIVGVGYDSFEEMKILDGDDAILSHNGKSARRDIVQFVELRKFLPPHRRLSDVEMHDAKKDLEKEVLQELPLQLTSYMKSKGIAPKNVEGVSNGYGGQHLIPNSARSTSSRHQTPSRAYSESLPGTPRVRRQLPQIPTTELQKLRIQ